MIVLLIIVANKWNWFVLICIDSVFITIAVWNTSERALFWCAFLQQDYGVLINNVFVLALLLGRILCDRNCEKAYIAVQNKLSSVDQKTSAKCIALLTDTRGTDHRADGARRAGDRRDCTGRLVTRHALAYWTRCNGTNRSSSCT